MNRLMIKKVFIALALIGVFKTYSQTTIVNPNDSRVITTGLPFALIAPDARSAAMGDMGVATSADAFSQQYNPSKYVFSDYESGFGVSYTPYLKKLVNDMGIAYLTYYNKLDDRSSFAASFKYFGLGEVEFRETENSTPNIQKPNEMSADISYALKLSDQYAMSVGMRYLRSNLRLNQANSAANPANTIGVDISGYYQGEEQAYSDFNGLWRFGFAIQNLGPKFKYDDGGTENFQPTMFRIGGGFDFIFDEYNKISVTTEFSKLLVPTPPELGYVDTNDSGTQNGDEPTIIVRGQDPDVGFMAGVFQSFGDAPGGFKEELQEFTYAVGAEYVYQDAFAFRTGYFHESEEKGARNFFGLGAGFKYNVTKIDLSYLFSAAKVQSPLEGTLRFSLTFGLGANSNE